MTPYKVHFHPSNSLICISGGPTDGLWHLHNRATIVATNRKPLIDWTHPSECCLQPNKRSLLPISCQSSAVQPAWNYTSSKEITIELWQTTVGKERKLQPCFGRQPRCRTIQSELNMSENPLTQRQVRRFFLFFFFWEQSFKVWLPAVTTHGLFFVRGTDKGCLV